MSRPPEGAAGARSSVTLCVPASSAALEVAEANSTAGVLWRRGGAVVHRHVEGVVRAVGVGAAADVGAERGVVEGAVGAERDGEGLGALRRAVGGRGELERRRLRARTLEAHLRGRGARIKERHARVGRTRLLAQAPVPGGHARTADGERHVDGLAGDERAGERDR